MISVNLSTREPDDQIGVALLGELDVADAASVAASLIAVVPQGR